MEDVEHIPTDVLIQEILKRHTAAVMILENKMLIGSDKSNINIASNLNNPFVIKGFIDHASVIVSTKMLGN